MEAAFREYTNREDIGIILINQHCANLLRHLLKDYDKTIPTVLEIPSKDEPYDAEQDYIMQVRRWAVRTGLVWLRLSPKSYLLPSSPPRAISHTLLILTALMQRVNMIMGGGG